MVLGYQGESAAVELTPAGPRFITGFTRSFKAAGGVLSQAECSVWHFPTACVCAIASGAIQLAAEKRLKSDSTHLRSGRNPDISLTLLHTQRFM